MDNLSSQIHGENAGFPEAVSSVARCLRGDVTVREDWLAALEGQDAVVHLAAETGTGQSLYEAHRYAEVNVMGTALLTDLLQERESHCDGLCLRRLARCTERAATRATTAAVFNPSRAKLS